MPASDAALDKSKGSEKSQPIEDDWIIGDRVWVDGVLPGYIQYLGETRFSPGEWAGVVLDEKGAGKHDGSVAGVHYFQCEPRRGVFARLSRLTRYPSTTAPSYISEEGSSSGRTSPLAPPRPTTPCRAGSPRGALRVGDRVAIAGSTTGSPHKTGILRYMGPAAFASGEWAGIELDQPLGKNDGSVAGKRYFNCTMNFGLFVPLHKVIKAAGKSPRLQRSVKTESEDSLSGNSSFGSTGTGRTTRSSALTSNSKAPLQPDQQIAQLQQEHRRYVEESEKRTERLRELLDAAENERRALAVKLEEEKRRVEDLQFRVDEECISKDDLEAEREMERQRVAELERKLEEEKLTSRMHGEGKTADSVLQEELSAKRSEVSSLRNQLMEAQRKISNLEKKLAECSDVLQYRDEARRKEEQLLQAQVSLDSKKREVTGLQDRIAEMENELEKQKLRQKRNLEIIDDLNSRLRKSESDRATLDEEVHMTREYLEERDRRLAAAETESRALREQLEGLLVTATEDQRKDSALQEEVRQKNSLLAELEGRLNAVEQNKRREIENLRSDHRADLRSISMQHEEEIRKMEEKLREMERNLKHEFVVEIDNMKEQIDQKDHEIRKLRNQLEEALSKENEAKDDSETLNRQMDEMRIERDLSKIEKEEAIKRWQVSEEKRRKLEEELETARKFMQKLTMEKEGAEESHVTLLKSEVQRLRSEFARHREDLVQKLAETERDADFAKDLHEQIETQRSILEELSQKLRSSETEKAQLAKELAAEKLKSKNSSLLTQELEEIKRRREEWIGERESLERSLEAARLISEQKQQQIDTQHKELSNLRGKEKHSSKRKSSPDYEILGKDRIKSPVPGITEGGFGKIEKESLESQIDFLNSVIVDMQHKNDDLKGRLEILETEVIFDRGQIPIGNHKVSRGSKLYCDICDSFDTHDTEDCPRQNSNTPVTESEMF